MRKLIKDSEIANHQLVILKNTNHYHQTDAICIVPIEVFVKSMNRPHLRVADIYTLNT